MEQLLKTIAALRAENGCPWDRKQTHESLIPYLEEEGAEVVEAILEKDDAHLQEELGDLLLQILLHAQIASERRAFNFIDVANTLNEKMVRRHPHVFAGKTYENEAEQKADWHRIKAEEAKIKGEEKGLLSSLDPTFSGLKRAFDLQKKAASVGFDWNNFDDVWAKVEEERDEFQAEIQKGSKVDLEAEFGDLLFALVNVARHLEIDPERAISRTNVKFQRRFSHVEAAVGDRLGEATLEKMDAAWNDAKAAELPDGKSINHPLKRS